MSSIVYIFCNPTSGGNQGRSIMALARESLTFPDLDITVKVFDIRDGESGNKPGFHDIKDEVFRVRLRSSIEVDMASRLPPDSPSSPTPDSNMTPPRPSPMQPAASSSAASSSAVASSAVASAVAPSLAVAAAAAAPPPPPLLVLPPSSSSISSPSPLPSPSPADHPPPHVLSSSSRQSSGRFSFAAGPFSFSPKPSPSVSTSTPAPSKGSVAFNGGATSSSVATGQQLPGRRPGLIRVIFAGGDGTVTWGMMELTAHDISPDDILVGSLPLGTGNDFARMSGWGGTIPWAFANRNLVVFKRWLIEIMSADTFAFDLWEVNVHLHEDGHFSHVKQGKTMTMVDADGHRVVTFKKMCCNYFSTGLESRIGLGFERNRTKSQTLNKLTYGIEGIKAVLLLKQPRIRRYVDELICGADTLDESPPQTGPGPGHETSPVDDGSGGPQRASFFPPSEFKHNPVSLIFENIPSMASGCDFWGGSYKHAIKTSVKDKLSLRLLSKPQEIGDGKVEVMTIKALAMYTKAQLGLPHGVAKRVAQSAGPFEVRFNAEYRERVYFQIDGENYACVRPRNATMHHARQYQVLVRKNCKLSVQGGMSKTGVSTMDFADLLETGQYGAREWQYGSERQSSAAAAPLSPSSDGGWDADWDDGRAQDAQLAEAAEAWGLLHDLTPLGGRLASPMPHHHHDSESDSDTDSDADENEERARPPPHAVPAVSALDGSGSNGPMQLSPLATNAPRPPPFSPGGPRPLEHGTATPAPAPPYTPATAAAATATTPIQSPATPSTSSKTDHIPEPSDRNRQDSHLERSPSRYNAVVTLTTLVHTADLALAPTEAATRKKSWPEEDRRAKMYLSGHGNGHAAGNGNGSEQLHANVHPAMPPQGFFFSSPDPNDEARRLGFVDVPTPASVKARQV